MEIEADSTSVSYSKFPSYLQSYPGSQFYSGYDSAVGYGSSYTAALQRSAHLVRIPSTAEEPHLGEYAHGITTPSPSDDNHSASQDDETNKEVLFRPVDFERFTSGSRGTSVPPTPPDSAESSDRGSCTEDDLPNVLLVRMPQKPPSPKPAMKGKETNRSSSDKDVSPPSHREGVTINLLDRELWKMFKSVGNEMIVTKPGR